MKTVFALFDEFSKASGAITQLQEHDFALDDMNALVLENVAKTQMETNLAKINVNVTDEVGSASDELEGLARLVGGEQPVSVPEVGNVYAAGDLATILTKSFSGPDSTNLQEALREFGVPDDAAAAYAKGINEGSVLLWVRSDDEKASNASNVFRNRGGKHITNNGASSTQA